MVDQVLFFFAQKTPIGIAFTVFYVFICTSMVYYSVIIDPSYFPYLLFSDAPFIPCICITKNVFHSHWRIYVFRNINSVLCICIDANVFLFLL